MGSNWIEENEFYNNSLFHYQDKLITGNDLNAQTYATRNIERDNISAMKIQCSIKNTQTMKSIKFNLTYNEVFVLLQKVKALMDNVQNIIEEINKNKTAVKTQSVKLLEHNKMLYISFIFKTEYNAVVTRISFSDKEETTGSDDKVYLDILSFGSFMKLLGQFRDNYIMLVSNMQMYIRSTIINKKLENIEDQIRSIRIPAIQSAPVPDLPMAENIPVEGQTDLEKFVEEKIDDIKLEIDVNEVIAKQDISSEAKKKVSLETDKRSFVEIFLKNDISNIENQVQLALTSANPVEVINRKITDAYQISFPDFKLYVGCDSSEYNAIENLLNVIAKFHIRRLTIDKVTLPDSINPVYYTLNPDLVQNENLDIVYDLLLIFTYYTQLRNALKENISDTHKNKEYQCFLIKTLLTPIVFTYFSNDKISSSLNKEVFIAEILRRYKSYNEKGYFKKLTDELSNYQFKVNIDATVIKASLEKLLNAYLPNYHKYTYDSVKEKYVKLGAMSQDVKEEKTEQNRNLNKVDNGNLKRYIQETQKELSSKDQEVINKILKIVNMSYWELLDVFQLDYSNLSEEALKAICCWDVEADNKITINYNYFTEKVKNSSLTKPMCISILHNLNKNIKNEKLTNCIDINLL